MSDQPLSTSLWDISTVRFPEMSAALALLCRVAVIAKVALWIYRIHLHTLKSFEPNL